MLILSGTGALTAGEIARATGLTTASVTSLIDRLESKGFVQRVRDSKDRRRVIVEPNQTRLTELMQAFGVMGEIFVDLFDGYTGEQLTTILDFVTRITERSNAAIQKLNKKIENTESS
jgi:DNA-binding MarR family transcriptional regulator